MLLGLGLLVLDAELDFDFVWFDTEMLAPPFSGERWRDMLVGVRLLGSRLD